MNWNPWCCLSWCVGSPPLGACRYKLASTGEEVASHCRNFPFCATPTHPPFPLYPFHFWFVSLYWQYYCSTPPLRRTPPPLPSPLKCTTLLGSLFGHGFDLLLDACKVFLLWFLFSFAVRTSFVSVSTECANCKYYSSHIVLFPHVCLEEQHLPITKAFMRSYTGNCSGFLNEWSHIRPFSNLHLLIVGCGEALLEHSGVPLVTIVLLEMALILASSEVSSFYISFVFFFFEKNDNCKCPLVYVSY